MASRRFNQFGAALEREIVVIYVRAAIGASGAPTLNKAKSKGVASIARNSTGKYTVTLQDRFVGGLFSQEATVVLASGGLSLRGVIRADNSSAAAKTVVVEFVDNAGTATEIPSGATLLFKYELKNSNL